MTATSPTSLTAHTKVIKQIKLEPPTYSLQLVRLQPCLEGDHHHVRFVLRAGDQMLREHDGALLVTNYPVDGYTIVSNTSERAHMSLTVQDRSEFERNDFQAIPFVYDHVNDAFVEIEMSVPGAYEYYVAYNKNGQALPARDVADTKRAELGYIIVEPRLYTKPTKANASGKSGDKVLLPLDGIALQTFVPKWLGPLSEWDRHFKVCQQLGFNMVHFVPLQKRGSSGSPYSIYDQLAFSDDLFTPSTPDADREQQLQKQLLKMEQDYGILSMTDVVWNHTACNCEWLKDHPEAGYNMVNSPHLRPAFELDEALLQFSRDLQSKYNISPDITTEQDLERVLNTFKNDALPVVRLWEFFVIDVKDAIATLRSALDKLGQSGSWTLPPAGDDNPFADKLDVLVRLDVSGRAKELSRYAMQPAAEGTRFHRKLHTQKAVSFMLTWYHGHLRQTQSDQHAIGAPSTPATPEALELICAEYQRVVDAINIVYYTEYDQHLDVIMGNLANTIRWERVNEQGPQRGTVTASNPLISSYFTRIQPKPGSSHPRDALAVANNGWIWNANPMVDFASAGSNAYLRREVIVWGDCVKLRYGKSRDDSPWLWDHMAAYTKLMAKLFHGFRIDNCHSTPIHVAQYLLDQARRVRPDVYVIAELFTGSEDTDRVFVSKLGINSLIREAMQAWDTKELSRLIHRYSGDPVGSFSKTGQASMWSKAMQYNVVDLKRAIPHAIFMDCTHDNEAPAQKRTAADAIANAAVVAMACCAVGSVRGYDELVPRYLDIVNESRRYKSVDQNAGIGPARSALNHLHSMMAAEGYSEIYVHQESQYIVVHRQHPVTHRGYMLVARTAFNKSPPDCTLSPVVLRSTQLAFLHGYSVEAEDPSEFARDKQVINGLRVKTPLTDQSQATAEHVLMSENGDQNATDVITNHPLFAISQEQQDTIVHVSSKLPPGGILMFETWLRVTDALTPLHELETFDGMLESGIQQACEPLDLNDINVVLYRVDNEERDMTGDNGAYGIPNCEATTYCGLEGFASILKQVMRSNDLGHPICQNLRDGPWMMDYVVTRLHRYADHNPNVLPLAKWLDERFALVRAVPNFLAPKYFSVVFMTAYYAVRSRAFAQMSRFVRKGSSFVRNLALTSVQMHGTVRSTGLHPTRQEPSLAAGLPHFAVEYMRCWGRDVFLSLPGLFLVTGQHEAAKRHIVRFASTLRHGLIPNLLDSGRRPRYNARDATWFFLHGVQQYTAQVPSGLSILDEKVPRRFPLTDEYVEHDDSRAFDHTSTIAEIVQEILQRHANGIHFREWNAGPNLDHAMRDPGFQIDIDVDWKTGFVHGGNSDNCGTWMDKMGDSEKAGNKGVPTTPRDGADIEITGLLKSTLRWLAQLHHNGHYEWEGVTAPSREGSGKISFAEWDKLVQDSFEKQFYIPTDAAQDADYEIDSELVSRRGMYKDTVGSSKRFGDYQLRPNQYIAMAVAPEMFKPAHALNAIRLGREVLAGPLGMRTLDPKDWAYRGVYDNANDSNDPLVAKGANYHQGPEWVWVSGYFYRALLHFEAKYGFEAEQLDEQSKLLRTLHNLNALLAPHKQHIAADKYAGLPELTNMNGAPCYHGCPTQAWSSGTLLELENEMYQQRVGLLKRSLSVEEKHRSDN
ncbi:bifunctional 4-alpha-glucanotransferase/amylo-alpha-1,6-glucosidase [Sorochytrium milnesiophthora]